MKRFSIEKCNCRASVRNSLIPFSAMLAFSVLFVLLISGSIPIPGFEPPTLTPYISVFNSRFTVDGTNDLLTIESSPSGVLGERASAADVSVGFSSAESLLSDGYSRTVRRFVPDGFALGFGDPSVFSPSEDFSYSSESKDIVSKQTGVLLETVVRDVPVLEPKMGFVFRHNEDGSTALYDKAGYLIYDSIPDSLTFTGERDKNDNAVFSDSGSFVVWDSAAHKFVPSDYNPVTDVRGANGCAPQYYGRATNELTASVGANGRYGYSRGSDLIISQSFAFAYPFHNGLGVCTDDNGAIHVVNTSGAHLFGSLKLNLPDTDGSKSMGYYFFEDGIMLAKLSETDADGKVLERPVALKSDETLFSLPGGYSPVSYSDGAILLEKNGRFGFMSTSGKWICDPLYTYAEPYFEGLAVVGSKDGKKGIIDLNGNFVIPAVFDYISNCQDGVITMYDETSGWCVLYKFAK